MTKRTPSVGEKKHCTEYLLISDVRIKGNRQREDFGDIEALKESLREFGQLQPIILSGQELIGGERRLTAARELGWTKINTVQLGTLTKEDKQEIELEENLQRKQLTWQEEDQAIAALYEMRSKKGQTMRSIAASLKFDSQYKVFSAVQMSQAIKEVPLIAKAKTRHKAKKLMQMVEKAAIIKKRLKEKDSSHIDSAFVNADCRDYLKTIPDESVDCVLTDPPFGIDIEKITRSGIGAFSGRIYQEADTKEGVLSLLDEVIPELFRVLKPNSHLHLFFAYPHYQIILDMLTKAGFDVSPIPNIWRKEGVTGQTNRPEKWYGVCYEPIFFAHKGLRPLHKQGQPNIFSFGLVNQSLKKHPLEKPLPLLQHILSFSCEPGDVVLDPFAGVGTVLQAAYLSKVDYLGCEIDKSYWALGQDELIGFAKSEVE